MKKVLLFFIVTLLLTTKASAKITEGKSSVHTSVTNNVNSSSNSDSETKTHIEIEVNGEKKVLDSDQPGTHSLSIESNGGNNSASVNISTNSTNGNENSENEIEKEEDESSPEEDIGENGEIIEEKETAQEINKTVIQRIFDQISEFFKKIFPF